MNTVYIYELCEPGNLNDVFYVGQTVNPDHRFRGHLRQPAGEVGRWLRKLERLGKQPDMRIIEILRGPAARRADDREGCWIRALWACGYPLLNTYMPGAPTWSELAELVTGIPRASSALIDDLRERARKQPAGRVTAFDYQTVVYRNRT